MRVLVNYLPVDKGGGLQNAVNFYIASLKNKKDDWFILTRANSEISKLKTDSNHTVIELDIPKGNISRTIYDNITLNKYAKKFNVDIIFTIVGPGPLITKYKTLNGWHDAFMVYPKSKAWGRFPIKTRVVLKLKYKYINFVLKRADKISVQTKVMKNRMISIAKIKEKNIFITPNGINTYTDQNYLSKKHKEQILNIDKIKLLLLAVPSEHKNFNYLFKMAKLMKDDKFIFIVSIDKNSGELSKRFIEKVEKNNLSDRFIFIGRVEHREIKSLYENIDAVFLPTLLESFSANYAEALYFKRVIFTSDLDFARNICKDLAIYFNPLKPKDGLKKLNDFYKDSSNIDDYLNQMKNSKISYPTWDEKFEIYYKEMKKLINNL